MIRSLLLSLFLLTLSLSGSAQESSVEFHTPPEWRGESIQLPPGFAPDLKWNGVEHIRFAPGMFQPDSESFFSYVLVFLLKDGDDVSEAAVKEQILTYYQGLAKAVMGSKQISVDTSTFTLELGPLENPDESPPAAAKDAEVKTWNGVLDWVEPFATQKKQALTIEVHLWNRGKNPVVYFTVSPQDKDHEIWKEMRKYRSLFELK